MMELWDLESRVTSGSRETLDDFELLPLEHGSHDTYRGSMDVLGLEVPSMELWDEQCGPNDGFGFCGGLNGFIPPKKWKEVDDSSSSGIHCDAGSDSLHPANKHCDTSPRNAAITNVASSTVTHVKSVDDYGATAPRESTATKQRRYRKRTKHGRFATVDNIDYDPGALPVEKVSLTPRNEDSGNFKRQAPTTRSLNHINNDYLDKGSITNFFMCNRNEGLAGSRDFLNESPTNERHRDRHHSGGKTSNTSRESGRNGEFSGGSGIYYNEKESVFPYGRVKMRSSSCDELTPRPIPVDASMRSTSQVLYEEPLNTSGNSNHKGGGGHKRTSSLFNAVSWLGRPKSAEFLDRNTSKSCESVNAYIPDDPTDLKAMTNVKVVAIESYKAKGGHELSFKKGQKLKLKNPSMDGQYAFGWKRNSRIGHKKYGYFPLSHVQLYEK